MEAGDKGGDLYVKRGNQTIVVHFASAEFGTPLLGMIHRLVTADSLNGCDSRQHGPTARGAIIIVRRGGCSFTDKAISAAKVGGKGVIIVNTDDSIMRMPAAKGLAPIKIEAAMYDRYYFAVYMW